MSFRDGPLQDLKVPLAWTAAVAAIIVGLISFALVLEDHRASARGEGYGAIRSGFDEIMQPVSAVFAAPLRWTGEAGDYVRGYFNAVDENRRLRAEVVDLQRFKDAAVALKNINGRYEALLKLRTEPPLPSITARVVADAHGPFSHARLADAGEAQGVKVGNPVISEHGVVGRVVGVARNVSRVLLLTDVDSRTPVLVNSTNARAVLAGDGGDSPKLLYLRGREPVKVGDVIFTSGDGGLYPRGLPVGVADKDVFGQWRVRLYSDRGAIDFVRILEFDDFSRLADLAALNNRASPPISAAEQAQVQQTLAARMASPKPEGAGTGAPPAADGAAPAAKPAEGATAGAGPARTETPHLDSRSAKAKQQALKRAEAKAADHKASNSAKAAILSLFGQKPAPAPPAPAKPAGAPQ